MNWVVRPLEECLDALIDYRGVSPPKSAVGIPVLSAKVIKGGRILRPIEQTISPQDFGPWMRRGFPEVGDVVLTTEGPLGEVAQIDDQTYALGQRIVVLRGKTGTLDSTFLKYLLISRPVQESLFARATGTTVAGISQATLRTMPIRFPERLSDQQAIAQMLGALDDKIEANRRMNATLEALACALFKSWFVDFDPVRAKMEGRDIAMAPDLAALFPDALVESAPSPIPEGWDVRQLREVVSGGQGEIRTGPFGSQLHQADYSQTGTPVVMPANLIDGSIDQNGIARIDDGHVQRLKDHQLRLGDIVYGRRGDIGRKALVGPDEVGWLCGTGCLRIRCASDRCPPSYLFHYLGHEPIREWIATRAIGATMPNLNTGILGEVEVLLPTNGVAMAFDAIVAPLISSSRLARRQSSTLTQLRDLLLPKLLSGALRVPDAERLIGDAA